MHAALDRLVAIEHRVARMGLAGEVNHRLPLGEGRRVRCQRRPDGLTADRNAHPRKQHDSLVRQALQAAIAFGLFARQGEQRVDAVFHEQGFLLLEEFHEAGQLGVLVPHQAGEAWEALPREVQQTILDKRLRLYVIDASRVARETGLFDEAIRHYEQSLVLMRRLDNQGGVADAWRMMGRTFATQKRYEDAMACCHTSQSIAERGRDELRVGAARYVLAQCYEELGRLREASELMESVVQMDRKYKLPKLDENTKRLERLRAQLVAEDAGASRRESNQ